MSVAGNSNHLQTLYQAARGYRALGFSVIPLHQGKVAAVGWKPYQQRLASEETLESWFLKEEFPGLGIVTGAVSQLLVVDFDDRHLYARFRHARPELVATYTVRTRRGWHLYYCIGFNLKSRKGQGIDLQADGSYVVAPPTVIDGHIYAIHQAIPPKSLTNTQIESLLAFFESVNPDTTAPPGKRETGAFSGQMEGPGKACPCPQKPLLTIPDLLWLYEQLACRGSRNEALFRVSLRARDHGWTEEAVVAALANRHTHQLPNGPHRKESPQQRHAEARHTIASAFSRPPGMFIPGKEATPQVPNSVRELWFQTRQTALIRVVEGLRLAGIQPGQSFTTAQALKLLQGRVGRDSIYRALKAKTDDGQPFFSPSGHPQQIAHADTRVSKRQPKNAFLVGFKNQEKPLGGRPSHSFIMPTNLGLCRQLGVKLTASDPLTEDDLASAKQTRMAAHRELIRRRPGTYSRRWLARRLGVCTVTLDTYNREIPIQVQPCFSEKLITWHNLNEIPLSLEVKGTFLEIETGKRYPAKREIALRLLAWKHTVTYKRQDVNFYWYGEFMPPAYNPTPPVTPPPFRPRFEPFRRPMTPDVPAKAAETTQPAKQGQAAPIWVKSKPSEEAIDRLAARVYREVKHLAEPSQRLSQVNARKLVAQYGCAAVEQGLKRLRWYARKGRVEHPAGFLVTSSRLAWQKSHNERV